MILPKQHGGFVANIEMVLDVYKRPYDAQYPAVCMNESPKQLISEITKPIPASPRQPARSDYEYKRCGICNISMSCEPLVGRLCMVKITERQTKKDWAHFFKEIAQQYQDAKKITLVIDNLHPLFISK